MIDLDFVKFYLLTHFLSHLLGGDQKGSVEVDLSQSGKGLTVEVAKRRWPRSCDSL